VGIGEGAEVDLGRKVAACTLILISLSRTMELSAERTALESELNVEFAIATMTLFN
jgi:hypothetical protein